MDEIVKRALARWPDVPHCTGWLMLDRRGTWRMRDEAVQASGAPGEPIRHEALLGFINRNYACDEHGQWFFQNGPQRVYVELGYTPWVVRLAGGESGGNAKEHSLTLSDQAGGAFEPAAVFLDDEGNVLFQDVSQPPRIAVLHDHDLALFSAHAALEAEGTGGTFHWRADRALPLQALRCAEVQTRFGFVASPARARGATPARAR